MKLIDRYTLRQVIVGFVLVLTSMTVLVWLTQSLRMIDMIVTKGVSIRVFLKLTFLVLPNFLQILSPLALFAVALFTLIRMQSDKELMVMQAVGMSAKQIMRPIFLLGGILMCVGFILSIYAIPAANRELREMKWQIKNDFSHLLLQEGQFNSFKNGLTLYVRERGSNGQVKGVLAYELKKDGKKTFLSADSGLVFQELDGIRVEFHDGIRQEYQPGSKQFSILKFEKYTMLFADKGKDTSRNLDVRELSMKQLWQTTPNDVGGHLPTWRKHKVEIVKRLTQPIYNLTYLFLVIFGVLSCHYNRRGQNSRIYTTVGLALIVQCLALAFENMSNKNLWFLILFVFNVFLPIIFLKRLRIPHKKIKLFGKTIAFLVVLSMGIQGQAADLKFSKINPKAPADFEADQVSYNYKDGTMNATGHVVLKQEGLQVETEKIIYRQKENQIFAPELVTLKLDDGTVAKTREGVFSGQLDSMQAGQTDIYLYEGSYLGAEKMERLENGDSYLTEAVYTPCDLCENKSPLWRLRSKTVRHDSANQNMIYKNVFFDVKNVPVGYVPYWQMPDFSVKRRSGFLSPSYSSTREMRHGVSIPYFIDLSENQNLLLTGIIAQQHFPMGLLDYQGRFEKSAVSIQASGTKDRKDHRKQGHIKASVQYDLTENWRLSGHWYRTATDTYFRRYRLPHVDDSEPFLTSHLTAERFGNRNYFRFKNYSFQSLQDGVSSHSIPVILPVLDYQYNTMPLENVGLYGFTAVNAMMFNTRDKFKSDRLSVTQGVRLPYILPIGLAIDFEGYVRADGYAVDSGKYGFSNRPAKDDYSTGRVYANASATVRYPFVKNDGNITQILEPVVMFVAAPNGGNSEKIPNVDSLVFDFDDTDLFSSNRFSGYDRVEPGSRINYGIKWSRFNHKAGRSISALIGQSYRFDDDEMMAGLMGYDPSFSDYVGRVQISIPYLSFLYRARLDQKSLKARKNEISIVVGSAPLKLGVSYVMRKAYRIGDNFYGGREEITYTATSQLSRNWSASGKYRYNLSGKGRPVGSSGSLQYDNECMALLFEVDKSFARDRDYKGSVSFMAKIILKTLGGM